jgi:hypothetical protein
MSSKSTAVLLCAISDFEKFMTKWEKLGTQHEVVRFWTEISLDWAKKYYKQMDETDVYVITMCKFYCRRLTALIASSILVLNPSMCFSWIEKEWEAEYIQDSKNKILNLVSTINHLITYHRHISHRCTSTVVEIPPHASKLPIPIPLSTLFPTPKIKLLQHNLKSKIPLQKAKPHTRSSQLKQNTGSMH